MAVEDPGSLVRQHLRNAPLETPPVTVDSSGLRVDELAANTPTDISDGVATIGLPCDNCADRRPR